MWLVLGLGALVFRTVQLFFVKDVQTGLVWITKIVTDPFHDIMPYYRAPLHLLRGELIDPMDDVAHRAKHLRQQLTLDGPVGEAPSAHHQPSRCMAWAARRSGRRLRQSPYPCS